MNKNFIMPILIIIIGGLVAAPAVQADPITATIIWAGVFFTSMAVNEIVFVDEDTTQVAQDTTQVAQDTTKVAQNTAEYAGP